MKPADQMRQIAKDMLAKEFENVATEHCKFLGRKTASRPAKLVMDVFGWTEGGDSCEIEIKVADYDFHKEFTKPIKKAKHRYYRSANSDKFVPTRFYYFVLSNLTDRALKRIKRHRLPYGLIEFNSLTGEVKIVRKSERLTRDQNDNQENDHRNQEVMK